MSIPDVKECDASIDEKEFSVLSLRFSVEVLAFNRRVKREAGAIPARMRHCEQRARRQSEATVPEGMGRSPERDDLEVRRPASNSSCTPRFA